MTVLDRRQLLIGIGALAIAGCHHDGPPAARPVAAPPPPPPPPTPAPPAASSTTPTIDLAPWRDGLARARTLQVARIDAYASRKRFPINHRALDQTPIFIDFDHGEVPCAVGQLMIASGWRSEAYEIARADNHVLVETVTQGRLVDWILRSGLTQEECALIQPKYHPCMNPKSKGCDLHVERQVAHPTELQRLLDHFQMVHDKLVADTDTSLAVALARLTPAIEAGATLDQLVA